MIEYSISVPICDSNKACTNIEYYSSFNLGNEWRIGLICKKSEGNGTNEDIGLLLQSCVDYLNSRDCLSYDAAFIDNMITHGLQTTNIDLAGYAVTIFNGRKLSLSVFGDCYVIVLDKTGTYRTLSSKINKALKVNCNYEVTSLLLCTDGIYNSFFSPISLRELFGNKYLYVPAVSVFMDPIAVNAIGDMQSFVNSFLNLDENYDSTQLYSSYMRVCSERTHGTGVYETVKLNNTLIRFMYNTICTRTVMGFINPDSIVDSREYEYYAEPDWKSIQQSRVYEVYPELFDDKPEFNTVTNPEPVVVVDNQSEKKDTSEVVERKEADINTVRRILASTESKSSASKQDFWGRFKRLFTKDD